jgi:hypothetical protein
MGRDWGIVGALRGPAAVGATAAALVPVDRLLGRIGIRQSVLLLPFAPTCSQVAPREPSLANPAASHRTLRSQHKAKEMRFPENCKAQRQA